MATTTSLQQLQAALNALTTRVSALEAKTTAFIQWRKPLINMTAVPAAQSHAASGVISWTWTGVAGSQAVTYSIDGAAASVAPPTFSWGPLPVGEHRLDMFVGGAPELSLIWNIEG
jgi:hypothetical protein